MAATVELEKEYEAFKKIFHDLRQHADEGLKAYKARRSDSDAQFHDLFETLDSLLPCVEESQQKLAKGASRFDFLHVDGTRVRANGYRSLLFLLDRCLYHLLSKLQKFAKERGGLLFFSPRAVNHLSSITSYCRALQGLEVLTREAAVLMEGSLELFNDGEMSHQLHRVACGEYVCRDVFYGRCLGFQYSSTLKPMLKMIAIAMASYEKWYRGNRDDPVRQLLLSLWKGGMYWQNPSKMGLKLDDVTQDCSVFFTKAFWSIMELDIFRAGMNLISLTVEISNPLEVPAKNITLQGSEGEVMLTPPYSDLGYRPIPLLLVSYRWRTGQHHSQSKKQPAPPARGLIIHFHGGGFVSQSPKSHEVYLRSWSRELDVPVVSVDYSLAPEAPFPRPLDECVFAYAWALQNLEKLGTTGEQIVLVGDSAGGNYAISTVMKLKKLGLRQPNRVVSCYPVTNCSSSASPSRFLAIMDPILPLGIMLSCQQAYTGNVPTDEMLRFRKESRKKILWSKGIDIPDPNSKNDAASPALKPKRKISEEAKERRVTPPSVTSTRPSANGNSTSRTTRTEQAAVTSSSQTVLPPPPEPQQEGADLNCDSRPTSETQLVSWNARENDAAATLEEVEGQVSLMSQGVHHHHVEPSENDEMEELLAEVLKSFEDSPVTRNPFMSPMLAPAEWLTGLPPVHIIGCALDPLLDDSIAMAQRLKSAGQPVTLNVVDNLPHGFLLLMSVGNEPDLSAAHQICLSYLRQGLELQ